MKRFVQMSKEAAEDLYCRTLRWNFVLQKERVTEVEPANGVLSENVSSCLILWHRWDQTWIFSREQEIMEF